MTSFDSDTFSVGFRLLTTPLAGYSTDGTKKNDKCAHERKLLSAIIAQALEDAEKLIDGRPTPPAAAAIGWFLSPRVNPFSFRWICFALGFNEDIAQHLLRQRFKKYLPQLAAQIFPRKGC